MPRNGTNRFICVFYSRRRTRSVDECGPPAYRLLAALVRRATPRGGLTSGRSRDPRERPLTPRSSGEAAPSCFGDCLDARVCAEGADKVADVVADGFAA